MTEAVTTEEDPLKAQEIVDARRVLDARRGELTRWEKRGDRSLWVLVLAVCACLLIAVGVFVTGEPKGAFTVVLGAWVLFFTGCVALSPILLPPVALLARIKAAETELTREVELAIAKRDEMARQPDPTEETIP